ncbi:hypothetical protein OAA60_00860 [Porticoccaceae bacterium]|nr:hypothetical protein [Porticoccaceae bacterium]
MKQTVIKLVPKNLVPAVREALPVGWWARGRGARHHVATGWDGRDRMKKHYQDLPMSFATHCSMYERSSSYEKLYYDFKGMRNGKPVLQHKPNGGRYRG